MGSGKLTELYGADSRAVTKEVLCVLNKIFLKRNCNNMSKESVIVGVLVHIVLFSESQFYGKKEWGKKWSW